MFKSIGGKEILTKPTISFIVPVYNKGHALEATLASLLNQDGPFDSEFIFVDDASTDNSVSLLEHNSDPRISIIRNADNRGPAIRLNQGARAARGDYLQFIDADDVLAKQATATMLRILQQEDADVIYGKWEITQKLGLDLLDMTLLPGSGYIVSDSPLHYVLTHSRIARMAAMTTSTCFTASGGCDEQVFVQDESLPLRIARKARRFIDFSGAIIYVPAHDYCNLSRNKVQQHHDGFCVFRNALAQMTDIDQECRRLLGRKAVSCAWKHYNRTMKGSFFSSVFIHYLLSKTHLWSATRELLEKLYRLFDGYQDHIRKPCLELTQ